MSGSLMHRGVDGPRVHQLEAATVIQSAFRGRRGRRDAARRQALVLNGIIRLQSLQRGKLARRDVGRWGAHASRAAARIQAVSRGWAARRVFPTSGTSLAGGAEPASPAWLSADGGPRRPHTLLLQPWPMPAAPPVPGFNVPSIAVRTAAGPAPVSVRELLRTCVSPALYRALAALEPSALEPAALRHAIGCIATALEREATSGAMLSTTAAEPSSPVSAPLHTNATAFLSSMGRASPLFRALTAALLALAAQLRPPGISSHDDGCDGTRDAPWLLLEAAQCLRALDLDCVLINPVPTT